jgi:histidinol-phosphate aminotransferase
MAEYPFTATIRALPASVPFVGPEALERTRGVRIRARIGANESVFGPSPKAIAAMATAAEEVWKYCDPENFDLKEAIASHHGIRPENVVVGEGIDGLFGYIAGLFIEPGIPVATSEGAYPTFNFHIRGRGGRLATVPYNSDREDPDALIALAKREDARLIYLANPDNPMATWSDSSILQRMIEAVPAGALLCLDEAYVDFAPEEAAPPLEPEDSRVVRFRTFSKAHGMAGARVGYAIGEKGLIASFDKIRNHFGVNRIAQAGALASLSDPGHLLAVINKVKAARERIATIASANGLNVLPSATNFVAIDCGSDGAFARRVLDELLVRGVFVRMPGVAPLNRCIRVSAGLPADLDLFEAKLPDALAAAEA